MLKKHVFLSYCHDNYEIVSKLHNYLKKLGEQVWWDKNILPGQNLKEEITKAIIDSYAIIFCFSKELYSKDKSGVFPELREAISIYREYPSSTIYIIPVRLSECKIPYIEIDSTTRMDNLLYIDFYPETNQLDTAKKIVNSLKKSPEHPLNN